MYRRGIGLTQLPAGTGGAGSGPQILVPRPASLVPVTSAPATGTPTAKSTVPVPPAAQPPPTPPAMPVSKAPAPPSAPAAPGAGAPGTAAAPGAQPLTVTSLLQQHAATGATQVDQSFVSALEKTGRMPAINWLLVGGIGVGAIVLMTMSKKKKKISGAQDWILPLAVLGVGGYLVYELFQGNSPLSSQASNQDAQSVADSNAAGVAAALSQAAAGGDPATLNAAQTASIANTVWTLGSTAGSGQADQGTQGAIQNQIIQVNSLTDLLGVIQAFGTKKVSTGYFSTCNLLGFNCDAVGLAQFLHLVLDANHLATINGFLSATNINYQF